MPEIILTNCGHTKLHLVPDMNWTGDAPCYECRNCGCEFEFKVLDHYVICDDCKEE